MDVRVWVGTFNLGGAEPDKAFTKSFLAQAASCDVVVFGAQEAHYRCTESSAAEAGPQSSTSRLLRLTGALGGALTGGALLSAALPLALLGAAVGGAAGAFAGAAASDELAARTHLFSRLHSALGASEFTPLATDSLLQLRLAVFVRASRFGLAPPPPPGSDAAAAASAAAASRFNLYSWTHEAGPVPGVATKGALGVSVTLPPCSADGAWSAGGTRLAFLCCHLAAHAGADRAALRNWQLRDALCSLSGRGAAASASADAAEARWGPGPAAAGGARLLEALHEHVFVFGDLNYRLLPDALPPAGASAADQADEARRGVRGWAAAVRCARSGAWPALAAADELGAERAAGRCPLGGGYSEGRLEFAPTFKLTARAAGAAGGGALGRAYSAKRVPAYTDRVLACSAAGAAGRLALLRYASCPEVASSDHHPVSALYTMRL